MCRSEGLVGGRPAKPVGAVRGASESDHTKTVKEFIAASRTRFWDMKQKQKPAVWQVKHDVGK